MKLIQAGSGIFVSRVGQVLANAAVVLLVAKILGPEQQGHYSLTLALSLLLGSLLAGGLGLAAVPPLRQGTFPAGRLVRAQLAWIALVLGVLVLLAGWTLQAGPADFLARHLGWTRGLGFIVLGAVAGILTFEIFSYNLLARGRLVIGATINGLRALGHFAAVGAVVLLGTMTFTRAVTLVSLAQVAGAAMLVVVMLRELGRPGPSVPAAADAPAADALPAHSLVRLVPALLRRGWVGQLSAVAYFLLLRLDQGILEHFRGAAEVGIYSVAVYTGEMLWLLPGALTPLLVHTSATGDLSEDPDRTALQAVRLGILVTLVVGIPLYLVAGPLLSFLAGGAYAESGAALRALLPGIIAFAPGAVLAGDFIGRGKAHWNTQASLLTVAVNVVAALWLIPRHGAVGAGWASSVAYAVGAGVMVARFMRESGTSFRTLLRGP